jgi:hypothetical protein
MYGDAMRTTIGLKRTTKTRLDHSRAPGQCYDGFLCQLIELWDETHDGNGGQMWKDKKSRAGNSNSIPNG